MKLTKAFLPLAFLVLQFCATTSLWAQTNYLKAVRSNLVDLLAPPPVPGSAERREDLALVQSVVRGRSEEMGRQALKSGRLSLLLFEPALGPWFQPGKLPRVEALFEKVKADIGEPIDVCKRNWERKRPYEFDESLLLGGRENSTAYPSGHSTRGTVYALVLAEVFPQNKEALLEIGREIGWDRIVLGKHFISDVRAGRVLGQALFRELQASDAFRRDVAQARAEAQKLTLEERKSLEPVPAGSGD